MYYYYYYYYCYYYYFYSYHESGFLSHIYIKVNRLFTPATASKESTFGVFLVCIFPHSLWIWRDMEYLSDAVRMNELWTRTLFKHLLDKQTPGDTLPNRCYQILRKTFVEKHLQKHIKKISDADVFHYLLSTFMELLHCRAVLNNYPWFFMNFLFH